MIQIDVVSRQRVIEIDPQWLIDNARLLLESHARFEGDLSITLLDNDAIHQANRQYLKHDYPTDVITFDLSEQENPHAIDGEILVSTEYAREMAVKANWSVELEVLLYVLHGVLHLCGYDDLTPADVVEMRRQEQRAFELLKLPAPPAIQLD